MLGYVSWRQFAVALLFLYVPSRSFCLWRCTKQPILHKQIGPLISPVTATKTCLTYVLVHILISPVYYRNELIQQRLIISNMHDAQGAESFTLLTYSMGLAILSPFYPATNGNNYVYRNDHQVSTFLGFSKQMLIIYVHYNAAKHCLHSSDHLLGTELDLRTSTSMIYSLGSRNPTRHFSKRNSAFTQA